MKNLSILILILVMCANISLAEQGLVAFWSFNNETANDVSGNGYHGTLMNSPTFDTGHDGVGKSIKLEGHGVNTDQGDHVLLPRIPFEDYDEFTICLWVKEEGVTHRGGESYIFFGDHSTGWLGLSHHIVQPDTGQTERFLQVAVGSIIYEIEYLVADFPDSYMNTWKNYILTYDGTTLKFYIDGDYQDEIEQEILIGTDNAGLARHWWLDGMVTSTRFTGWMDDVKIYNRVLTEDEIDCGCCTPDEPHFVDIDLEDDYLCEGDTIKLYSTIILDDVECEYSWTGPNGFTSDSQNVIIPNVTEIYSGVYTVTVETIDGEIVTNDTTVYVYNLENAYIVGDTVFCASQGTDLYFSGSSELAKVFWSTGETSYSIHVTQTGDYWVYYENSAGCSDTAKISVKSVPDPKGYIEGDTTFCALTGTDLHFQATVELEKVLWSTGETSYSIHVTETGDYWAYYENYYGCNDTAKISVRAIPGFEAYVEGDLEICRNEKTIITAFPDDEDIRYEWSTGNTGGSIETDSAGLYYVIVKQIGGCEKKVEFEVKFVDDYLPELNLPSPYKICEEQDIKLEVTNALAGYTYYWADGVMNSTRIVDKPGTYILNCETPSGCFVSDTVEILLEEAPKAAIEQGDDIVSCSEVDVILTAKETNSDYYKWSTGEEGKSIHITSPGTYWLAVGFDSGECPDTTYTTISVNDFLDVGVIGDLFICSGSSTIISTNYNGALYEYLWSTGETSPSIEIDETGQYWVLVRTNSGCRDSVAFEIQPGNTPDIVMDYPDPVYVCEGDAILLKPENPNSEYEYYWSTGEFGDEISVNSSGRYVIYATDGKCLDSAEVNVEVLKFPIAEIEASATSLCVANEITLTAIAGLPDYSYEWSTGEITQSIKISNPGSYFVVISNHNMCKDTAWIEIFENEINANISGKNIICDNEEIVLSSDVEYSEYEWSTGENSREITISDAGIYWLKVTDEFGCSGTDTIEVKNFIIDVKLLPQELIFPETCFGDTDTQTFYIQNSSNTDILFSTELIKSDGNFAVDSESLLIRENEEGRVAIDFVPKNIGEMRDTLYLTIDEPCSMVYKLPVYGKAVIKNTVELPHIVTDITSESTIIDGHITHNCQLPEGLTSDFVLVLSYDSYIFHHRKTYNSEVTATKDIYPELQKTFAGNYDFDVPRDSLIIMEGMPLLNKVGKYPLKLDSIRWDNPYIITELKDGSLKVNEVCIQNLRLIKKFESTSIQISPNPAHENLVADIQSEEEGRFSLMLINSIGEIIKKLEFANTSQIDEQIILDLSDIRSGMYNVILKAPWTTHHKTIMIVK